MSVVRDTIPFLAKRRPRSLITSVCPIYSISLSPELPFNMNDSHFPKVRRKNKEKSRLVTEIQNSGVEMIPCTHCRTEGLRCVKILNNTRKTRCSECVRSRTPCDAEYCLEDTWDKEVPRMSDWDSLDKQEEKLRKEEEEAMAKILRLRKQQDYLRERRKKMTERGLKYIDELDALEEKERLEKEKEREIAATSAPVLSPDPFGQIGTELLTTGSDSFDPSFLHSMDSPSVQAVLNSPSFWANPDSVGENPQTSQGA